MSLSPTSEVKHEEDSGEIVYRLSECFKYVTLNLYKSIHIWGPSIDEKGSLANRLRESSFKIITVLLQGDISETVIQSEFYLSILTLYQLCGG